MTDSLDAARPMAGTSIRSDATELLAWMKRLDDVMSTIMPPGSSVEVVGYSQAEVTETFFLARRSFGSVFLLMDRTIRTIDTDWTEDADILVRRLLELYARVAFVVMPESQQGRDLRAARVALTDMSKHLRLLSAGLDVDDTPEHRETVASWQEAQEQLRAEIISVAGTAKEMPPTTCILEEISPKHALHWRHSSDVAHGGVMGRAHQRHELTFGVPAKPSRQDAVMHTATAIMAEICAMWLDVMSIESSDFASFAEEFRSFMQWRYNSHIVN